jgi:DNA-binding LacI/PurR family transcriptional regulator
MPTVSCDSRSIVVRAEEYFRGRGRRRIAWFAIPATTRHSRDLVTATMRARRRSVPAHLVHTVHPQRPWAAQSVARLLMELPEKRRPDAVTVCDDNLVRDVTEGLAAAGVRAPHDVDVVAHANFPDRPPAALPVRFLGFDVREIMRVAFEALRPPPQGGRRSPKLPAPVLVPAVWEDELIEVDEGGPTVRRVAAWGNPAVEER